jgi:hypothetical protein
MEWQPIETAPKDGRQLILLKTPYSPDGTPAYSNTWWTCGFSVECTPTHWKLAHNVEVSGPEGGLPPKGRARP